MNQDQPIASGDNELISVLIFNYENQYLRPCFDAILQQTVFPQMEIIYVDDCSSDGSWEVAVDYSRKNPGRITLVRNKRILGPKANLNNAKRMARGKYYVVLHSDLPFHPDYIRRGIGIMEQDEFVKFKTMGRTNAHFHHMSSIDPYPLVSLCIFNFNYGRFLRQCLESVFAQSYPNVEICFSDNASTDDSWDIALEFAARYPGKMNITRNRENFGSDANFANCFAQVRGKYFVELCSDDALLPDFIRQCVCALESHPEAAYAMAHRRVVDAENRPTEEPPFYNRSCVIPGHEQAAVYMMAAVNPCISQVMYNTAKIYGKSVVRGIATRWYGTRLLDFNLCCEYSLAYIKEPLVLHRIHTQNDSSRATENLLEVIGPYILVHQYAEIASQFPNMGKVVDRLPASLNKLGDLCLRYCIRALLAGNEKTASRYFHLAVAVNPDLHSDPTFVKLSEYWPADNAVRIRILESMQSTDNLAQRNVSYDPPAGSIPIESILENRHP